MNGNSKTVRKLTQSRPLQNYWDRSFIIRRELLRDEFMVMPNHFHGFVPLVDMENTLDDTVGDITVETPGRASPQRVNRDGCVQNRYHHSWPGSNSLLPNE